MHAVMKTVFFSVFAMFFYFSSADQPRAEQLDTPQIVDIITSADAGGLTLNTPVGDIDAHLASFKPALNCDKQHTKTRPNARQKFAPMDVFEWRCLSEVGADGSYVKFDITTEGEHIKLIDFKQSYNATNPDNPRFDYMTDIKERALQTGLPMNAQQSSAFMFSDDTKENPSISKHRRQDLRLIGYRSDAPRTETFSLHSGVEANDIFNVEIRHSNDIVLQRD